MPEQDKNLTIKVNGNQVKISSHRISGEQIKIAAIEQGVDIELDFILFEVKNNKLISVSDEKEIAVNKNSIFRAIAPDDNS